MLRRRPGYVSVRGAWGAGWRQVLLAGLALLTAASACSPKPPMAPSATLAIASQPQSQTVALGGTATLNVSGVGSGPMSYQWYVGASGSLSDPIAGATASAYTTPPLLATTSYWARVSNTAGVADSATATVTVTPPSGGSGPAPTITTEPENDTIEPGQTAKLDVGVTGAAPLSYQWFTGPSGTTTSPIAGATTDVYRTPELSHTTSYWVRVWNAAGMADSVTATITVSSAPVLPSGAPTIATHPEDQTVASGQSASLWVDASGAAPLSYQWFVGAGGDTSWPVNSATSANLTTTPLTTTTRFWVRVSNAEGAADSEAATVTVSGPAGPPPPPPALAPTIVTQPQDQTVASGQAATVSVGTGGTAPFSYQWYQGASGSTAIPIAGAGSPSYTTPSLTSTTTYWVRVSNAYGSADSSAATITVTSGSSSSAFENDVLTLVNQHRAAGATCGGTAYPAAGPLTMDASLVSAARGHSLDMAVNNYFSHTSLDGRAFDDRMRDAGYSGAFPWGENIAAGYSTPQAVVSGWMASTGHCQNIMKSSYQVISVGHVYLAGSSYGNYWTQDFGGS